MQTIYHTRETIRADACGRDRFVSFSEKAQIFWTPSRVDKLIYVMTKYRDFGKAMRVCQTSAKFVKWQITKLKCEGRLPPDI